MVNEQVGTSEWEDGSELGATWESRNAFSYGRCVSWKSIISFSIHLHLSSVIPYICIYLRSSAQSACIDPCLDAVTLRSTGTARGSRGAFSCGRCAPIRSSST